MYTNVYRNIHTVLNLFHQKHNDTDEITFHRLKETFSKRLQVKLKSILSVSFGFLLMIYVIVKYAILGNSELISIVRGKTMYCLIWSYHYAYSFRKS